MEHIEVDWLEALILLDMVQKRDLKPAKVHFLPEANLVPIESIQARGGGRKSSSGKFGLNSILDRLCFKDTTN